MKSNEVTKKGKKFPHPPIYPLIGNVPFMSGKSPILNMMKVFGKYSKGSGGMMLSFPEGEIIILGKHRYVKDACDETRFDKDVSRPLLEVREFSGDGLFTAWTNEPNWKKAHNILLPGLGARAMKGYFPMMLDIAERLLAKWHNIPEGNEFNLTDDMTRLTFDTIGLCGFDYRFHSFSSDKPHPFIDAMVYGLKDSMSRMVLLPFQKKIRPLQNIKFRKSVDYMYRVVDEIISERKKNPEKYASKADFLSLMLNATDKESGEKLDDINIRYQILTFLIAGHETTSGLLSFAFYFMITHPEIMEKAYREVDEVLGTDLNQKPSYAQVNDLKYINQILLESLRLWPTAPGFSLYPYKDTLLDGEYNVHARQPVIVLTPMLHRDKEVWGDEPEVFNPDNFSPEAIGKRDPDAFKPFGNGQRACIGRQFAMLEATLLVGMVLQRYRLKLRKDYQLKIKETLTLKPDNLFVSLEYRKDKDRYIPEKRSVAEENTLNADKLPKHHTPFYISYGSNMGASEDFAIRIAQDAEKKGFDVKVHTLDESLDQLPTKGMWLIISSTYNGTPPDNAKKFAEWLEAGNAKQLKDKEILFSVFGCGNTQWKTFQKFPRMIAEALIEAGLKQLHPTGEADASSDFDDDFESWYASFWPKMMANYQLEEHNSSISNHSLYQMEILPSDTPSEEPMPFRPKVRSLKVLLNKELQTNSKRSTRHLELSLPSDMTYETGGHLLVYPENEETLIHQIMQRFGIEPDTVIRLQKNSSINTALPVDQPVLVKHLLRHFVELQEVISRKQLKLIAEQTICPPERIKMMQLCEESTIGEQMFKLEVMEKRKSVLDILLEFPAAELRFEQYLEMLPGLKPRYFSISSSAKKYPSQCNITAGVLEEMAYSEKGLYKGTCTNYLASRKPGDEIQAVIQPNSIPFRLPDDSTRPILMVGAGTGIAPFIAFLQEREWLKSQGIVLGKAMLFFGCRHPEQDFIYQEELKRWEGQGIVRVFTAFSRLSDKKYYVQQEMIENKEALLEMIQSDAKIYICGDADGMAAGVRKSFLAIYQQCYSTNEQKAGEWLNQKMSEQSYLEDIWSA